MASSAPDVGSQLLHYRVLGRLGAGGMGEVFLAEDTRLGRQVALKFLTAADGADPEARERLVREAQAASVLRSPHVAVTYDLVEHGDALFIAMEYVEGELLSARIARGVLDVSDALEIAMQVADALDDAHARGIVHRDIKSANIMLTARQLVKVLDFGLAKFLRRPAGAVGAHDRRHLARHGARARCTTWRPSSCAAPRSITAPICSPSAPCSTRCWPGGRRLPRRRWPRSAERILSQEPEALARFNYAVPADVDAVVRKALTKDPGFRYQSARELYLDLHHARERLARDRSSGTRQTWRPGMHLPPVGFGQAAAPVRSSAGPQRRRPGVCESHRQPRR